MKSVSSSNLLDEALGLEPDANYSLFLGRVVLVEDCVETSGAFLLHHLLNRSLTSRHASALVIFLSLAQSFSHYDRILRKLGCNLAAQRDNNRFIFFDMLKLECPGGGGRNIGDGGLVELYGKIQRTVEINASPENKGGITIMIDDLSLLEVAAHGSADHVLDFLHYCHTLTSELGCSLIILNHEDVYLESTASRLNLEMEYLADVLIKAEPLAMGLASDVHGQLTVVNKGILDSHGCLRNKIHNFHFKVKENNVEYFYPGSQV